jgi:glycosyltransferase involved in cell wall biosynthesis
MSPEVTSDRLRILHVISTGERRGAEMFAADLIHALAADDVDQRVAVLRGSPPWAAGFEAPTTVLASEQPGRIPGLRMDLGTAWRLRSICRRWRPHVIQAHGGEPFKYVALVAGRRDRIVYRRIGQSPGRASQRLTGRVYRLMMRRPRTILAVAEAIRRETIDSFGVSADRVRTIPRGVDPHRIASPLGRDAARARLNISDAAPVVISLGALSWEKDPIAHLQVMEGVRRVLPGSVHLIAGDGPLRPEVERRVKGSSLNGLARVLGSRSDIADLLAAADVLLLASRMEGMPGCVIEAGMAGLPVVSYAVAGVPEVVIDGETGYLVEAGDLGGLVDRMIELLSDRAVRATMGRAARVRCAANYGIDVIAPQYLQVYEEVRG